MSMYPPPGPVPPNPWETPPPTGLIPPPYPIVIQNTPPRRSGHFLTDIAMVWFGWFLRGKYDERQRGLVQPARGNALSPGHSLDGGSTVTMYDSTLQVFSDFLERITESQAVSDRGERRGLAELRREIDRARRVIADLRDKGVSNDLDAYPVALPRATAVSMRRVVRWLLSADLSLTSGELVKARLLRDLLDIAVSAPPATPRKDDV